MASQLQLELKQTLYLWLNHGCLGPRKHTQEQNMLTGFADCCMHQVTHLLIASSAVMALLFAKCIMKRFLQMLQVQSWVRADR